MSKRKQALRSLSANECGAVSALPTEPIRAQFLQFESKISIFYFFKHTFEPLITRQKHSLGYHLRGIPNDLISVPQSATV